MTIRDWACALALVAIQGASGCVVALDDETASESTDNALTAENGAVYQVKSRSSGKALDVCGQSTAAGACVQQFAPVSQGNQQFEFVASDGGFFRLRARHSGKVLEVQGASLADGASVVQATDTGAANQQWMPVDLGNGFVKLINRRSGRALDVTANSKVDGAKIIQYRDHGGPNQQWSLVQVEADSPTDQGAVGWATQGGGTTGGGAAAPTRVSTLAALKSALASSSDSVVRVSGTISCSGMLPVKSNKTVVGESGATLKGCGLNVSRASNVIVQDLTFSAWDDDAINVESSTRVWVDHNTFLGGFDGAVDVKRGSDFVTVSWNRFSNHDKAMLLGHSDDNGAQDRGHLRVTYHHNWFDGTTQRHPRVRFGNPVHVFNNYYDGVEAYGVASTKEACVIVERNFFESVDDPFHRGEGSSPAGSLVARDNTFVDSGVGDQGGGECAALPYRVVMEDSGAVKASVMARAGARGVLRP